MRTGRSTSTARASARCAAWQPGANGNLPGRRERDCGRGHADEFHARFSARSRTYIYRIINQPGRTALHRTRACWVPRPLDAALMRQRCSAADGARMTSRPFRRRARPGERPCARCTACRSCERMPDHDRGVRRCISTSHGRNIVGVLIRVGAGDAPLEWAAEVLAGRDPGVAGVTGTRQRALSRAVSYDPALIAERARHRQLAAALSV